MRSLTWSRRMLLQRVEEEDVGEEGVEPEVEEGEGELLGGRGGQGGREGGEGGERGGGGGGRGGRGRGGM